MTTACLLLASCLLATGSALAFQPPAGDANLEIKLPEDQNFFVRGTDALAAEPAAARYDAQLATELPGSWWVTSWNQYTQTAQAVEGSGLSLSVDGFADATEAQMEALGRDFIAAHPTLFGTDGSNLEAIKVVHGLNRWGIAFQQVERGVPVVNSSVLLAIHDNGRLFAFGTCIYQDIGLALRPTIERPVAAAVARAAVPFDPSTDLTPGDDALVILPIHRGPGQVEFHLAHRTDVPTSEPLGLWRSYVDAHSAEIVHRVNEVHFAYEGSSHADVEIITYCDGDTPNTPNAYLNVVISGVGTATTDQDGNFSVGSGSTTRSYTAQFDGPHFNANCYSCVDASTSGTITPGTPETIYWGTGDARADERDSFYNANMIKQYVRTIDPTWNLPKYNDNLNRPGPCNAYWSGTSINFYPTGGGCYNTGTIASVVAHEYGHGIQANLIGGQGSQGLGEGNGDIAASFRTDESMVGRGFRNCSSGNRECDNELVYPDDVVGAQIHDAGRVICAFNWHLRELLEARYGATAGKDLTATLWHFSRKDFGTPGMNQPQQVDYYRYADDDNGNLADGTPHWDEICEAATRHGYPCPVNPTRAEIDHTPLVDMTNPAGPYQVEADIVLYVASTITTPDAVEIHYSVNGGSFSSIPMINTGGNTYAASIPTQDAGNAIAYYLRVVHNSSGREFFHPPLAPTDYHLFGLGTFATVVDHEMEANDGYTIGAPGDNATQGIWERGDPVEVLFGIIQPDDDHTPAPGTDCWVTGNSDDPPPYGYQLDGRTSVSTPMIDMSAVNLVQGSFWAFTYFASSPTTDYLALNMSTDGGMTWTNLVSVHNGTSPDWVEYTFRLSPLDFNFNSQMQFRFVAEDVDGDSSVVEALVDDFYVEGLFGSSSAVEGPAAAAPLALQLGAARPNPFNPSTSIDYSLPGEAAVRLAVYDVQGRLIRNLVQGLQSPGQHQVSWDGRDARGVAVASGVYYYKLEVGDWSDTRAMVLLK